MFMYAANYDQFAFVDTLRHDGERVLAGAQALLAEHVLHAGVHRALEPLRHGRSAIVPRRRNLPDDSRVGLPVSSG